MNCMGTVGTVSSFQRRKYDVFYWEIDKFSKLSEKVGIYYKSPEFQFRGHRSFARFDPNGLSSESVKFFKLFFFSPGHDASSCVHLTLGLKTRNGSIEKWLSMNIVYPEEAVLGSAFIPRAEFLKRKAELAPSDRLTFVLFLSPDAPEIIRDVADLTEAGYAEENGDEEKSEKKDSSIQTVEEAKESGENQSSEKQGIQKLLEDFGKLLVGDENSDVTVQVENVEFCVHRAILSVRSPVLSAMFKHETEERASNRITIEDCKPDVFEEYLQYIYTGCVQSLTKQNVFNIYRIADKYLADDLKHQCLEYIQDTLCVQTFCETVKLAVLHGQSDLLQLAVEFAAKNIRLIIRSVEWQIFSRDHHTEANEILIKALGPPS